MSPQSRRPARLRPGLGHLALLLATPAARLAQQQPPQQQPQQTPPAASDQDTSAGVLRLTLEDALRIALANNLDLEIERLTTTTARYDALGSWGAFDPVLSATGTYNKQEFQGTGQLSGGSVIEDTEYRVDSGLSLPLTTGGRLDLTLNHSNTETNNQFAAFDVSTTDVISLALSQPLLRGAWSRYATAIQRESEIALERQIQRERQVRAQMLLDVYDAYWNLVNAKEELTVREVAVDLGEQQLAQDRRRLEVGAGTEVDVLQSETNVAQQEQLRLVADYAVIQARDTLRRMLSPRPTGEREEFLALWDLPIETLTPLPTGDDQMALEWRASLTHALESRPELAQRRLDISTADIQLVTARSERLPTLDLDLSTAGVGFDLDPSEAFSTALSRDFPSSTAALTFRFPLWNRSARYAERGARTNLRSAMLAYDRNELDVLAEVRGAVNEVDKQRESVKAAAKSRVLAQRQLEAEQTRQEVGLSTTFQVLQFQEDLARALSVEVASKAAYARALARLEFAEGRLGDDLEPVPGAGQDER